MEQPIRLIHAGLFEGIGGFSLGAKRAGIPTAWTCELNTFKRSILRHHFPNAKHYKDVHQIQKENIEEANILTAGFPCTDISLAGGYTGIFGTRSSLYTEAYRIAEIMRPRYIVFENVPQLRTSGLEYILYDLSRIGYDAQWTHLRAEQFGHRHKRKRIIIIAHPNSIGSIQRFTPIFRELQEIFPETEISEQTYLPGLLKRFDRYTDQRTFSANTRISEGLDKDTIHAVGDSINVDLAHYIFECIKQHSIATVARSRQK